VKELRYERSLREWMYERGMRHERLVYRRPEAGGDTVAYRLAPARGTDTLVLVAHGAGNDALFAFSGLFKQILAAGAEIFTFDLDGHGRTSTSTFRYPAIATALPEALSQARAGRATLRVHGLGVSLGGSILLESLAGPLAELASAALISPPLRIRLSLGRALNELRPAAFSTVLRNRNEGGLWGMVPSFGPVKRSTYPLRLAESRPGAFGYVDVLNEVLARLELEDAASRCRVPTYLAYGTADRIVPPEQGIRLERILPDSTLHLVRGGTHLTTPFHEQVVSEVLRWIGSVAGGAEGTAPSRSRDEAERAAGSEGRERHG
jgi:alpha-beta hydrolase superfamily lysophospholipase